jgi:nitrate/nitrite transport system permease protein
MSDVIDITTGPYGGNAVPDTLPPLFEPPPVPKARRLASAASGMGWALLGIGVLIVAWQLGAASAQRMPTPIETWKELWHLWSHGFQDDPLLGKGVGLHLLTSLGRVAKGFLAAAVVGVPLGLAIGSSPRAWKAINPLVQVLRPVSPLAWFPIWLALTSDGPKSAVVVIFITSLWPTVINTASGVASIPHEQQDVARVFRFGRLAYLRHVLVPNALPSAITGMRLSMGMAWMVIVAVEMLSSNSGIGFFVWDSYNAGNLAAVASAIVIIGVVGLVLDNLFLRLSRRFSLEVAR